MEPEQKSNGALLGLIVIVIILIIGGIYFWKSSLKEKALPEGSDTSGTTNETINLEANLNSLDLESLDSGI